MQAATYERRMMTQLEKSIPAHYYYDSAHYERELEVFWYNMWVNVGREEEIPNRRDYLVKRIGTQNIVVTRDLKGTLQAFHNTCRHRGSILCTQDKGSFEGGTIVCPYHAWTYSLEGDLIATPHQLESADFDMKTYSLYDVAVGSWGGYIFVNLAGKDAPPLESALGNLPARFANYHMDELRIGKRIVMDIKANWKLLFENFAECFHCPQVHPELCTIVESFWDGGAYGIREDENGNLVPELESRYMPGAQSLTMDGSSMVKPFKHLNEDELGVLYTAGVVRPNFFINVHRDYLNTHQMIATGPDSIQMVYDWLFEPEAMEQEDFDIDFMVELWDLTNRQDARNCEWQNSGLKSRHFKHGNFVPQEFGPHRFNQWVLDSLGEGTGQFLNAETEAMM